MSTKKKSKSHTGSPPSDNPSRRGGSEVAARSIRYLGPGLFSINDVHVDAGDVIDSTHPYAKHMSSLLLRGDFEKVTDDD